MKYFTTGKRQILKGNESIKMAQAYWGIMPLPIGAKIIGGYADKSHAGALILLASGIYVCGNAGVISTIDQAGIKFLNLGK